MKSHRVRIANLLNIVVVVSLLAGFLLPPITAVSAKKNPQNSSSPPSASVSDLPNTSLPETMAAPFLNPVEQMLQQAMGDVLVAEFWNTTGLMQITPFESSIQTHPNQPTLSPPTVNLPTEYFQDSLDIPFIEPLPNFAETEALETAVLESASPPPNLSNDFDWTTNAWLPQNQNAQFVELANISTIRDNAVSDSDLFTAVQNSVAPPRPRKQQIYQVYLPSIYSPLPEPNNEIVAVPDKSNTLVSTDNVMILRVPAQAVSNPTRIIYDANSSDNPVLPQNKESLYSFALNAVDTTSGLPVTQFNQPLRMTLPLPAVVDMTRVQQITAAAWTAQDGWEMLPTTINPADGTISATTNHFTHFDVLIQYASLSTSFNLAPYIPSQQSTVTPGLFYGISLPYDYPGGPVSLHPVQPGGTHLWTDDAVRISVIRPDGTFAEYYHNYDLGGPGINPTPPVDISHLFLPGINGIGIELIDLIGPNLGSSGYQILPGSACESTPPVIHSVDLTQTGQNVGGSSGTAVINVNATDNAGPVDVTVSVNGIWHNATPYGLNTYLLTVDYPINQMNSYLINVIDSCGNQTTLPTIDAHGTDSGNFGWSTCGKGALPGGCPGEGNQHQRASGDPVNTSNGNYYDREMDLFIPGVGGANLVVERGYNSMAALWQSGSTMRYTSNGSNGLDVQQVAGPPQYFGTGWTFPYAMRLNIQSYPPLYDGVQVMYPDGHTANFVSNGSGYVSTSPANDDTLLFNGSAYELHHKNSLEIERFDGNGRLISRSDRNGNTITLTYSGDQLARVENDSGRWIEFEYTNGYITQITAPEYRAISYTYTDDLLTGVTDGNGNTTTYAYDDDKQLTLITTPKGHTSLDQVYDDDFRVDWQLIGRAEINDFTYSDDGLTTTITDSYGRNTHYIYNDLGQIIEVEDALGFSETFAYDDDYNRTHYTDQMGRTWLWTYDDDGNRLTEDGPLGWHQEWTYNNLNLVTSQLTKIDSVRSRTTTFDYDSKGNLTGITNAANDTSTIIYDGRGLPVQVFDFNQNETANTYDAVTGDLLVTRNGAGDEVEFAYDGLGRMVSMTDGNDNVYHYTYDGNDNLTDIHGPLSYHIGYRYDANDNLQLEIDPNGGEIEYTYDASEMVTRIENQLDFATLFTYDEVNNLTRLQDAEGREWLYLYDAVYNQTAVSSPEDTYTFYTYNGVRNITTITECNSALVGSSCPDNRITIYEYNDLDQIETVVENYVDGAGKTADTNVTTHFDYDLVGNLQTLTDALNNQTLYEYDLLDRLVREEDAESQVTTYIYDKNGNLLSLTNPRNFVTQFGYDGANRLITMTDADNAVWQYVYDGNSNLIDEIDPYDVTTHYNYDALDRVSQLVQNLVPGGSQTADQNVTTGFEYDLAGNLRFVHDPRGGYMTEHQYDAAHRRVLTIDNENGVTQFSYDKVYNLTSVIDGNSHETTFQYDGLNRQTRITNPEGHSVQFSYDRLSNLVEVVNGRNYLTTFTYDGMNRVIRMVDALNGVWEYQYDAVGNVQCEIDANGHANDCYTYDDIYRVLTITDAENHTDSFTYDANGNRLTWTDGNGHVTTYSYDALDRPATMTNAENETTAYLYDLLGNQTHLIEADGIVTRYDYDPLYRLSTVNQNDQPGRPESADVNVDTHYVYDEVGNLSTIIDAELHETHFVYDGMNRLVQETDADFNVWQYAYDPVGNQTQRIDANGNLTSYTYYPDNQLETISYQLDGTIVAYTYDENNNRIEMVDHLGTTAWDYDALNRSIGVNDAFNRHLGYGYDAVGNRTGITYEDGRIVHYTYYDNNWLQSVTGPENNVTSYQRDGVGLVITTTNPNETISHATYDKANRLLTLVNQQTTGAQKTNSAFTYTYNEIGHRTQMIAEYGWRNPAVVTSHYTYDGLRRLIRDEDSEGVWTDYTFDRVGNRLLLETNDDSLSPRPFDQKIVYYTYSDANRLLSLIGNTHPGSPGNKKEDNVGQTIYAFRHEVAAQRGKHIHELSADNLLAMADALIVDLESNPKPSTGDITAAIEAIRVQVLSDRANNLIHSDGIANSLLAKLNHGDTANGSGANGEWQTQTFTYDANGNRINTEYPGPQGPKVQGTDYTYDPENRLIVAHDYQMSQNGNRTDRGITTLEYDGGGRRLAKTYDANAGGGGAKRVEYVFDGWDPVAEYNQWNPQYENFYRGDMNRIITMQHFPNGTAGQMYWYHYDGLGSVAGLTKHHGQSHHNYRYEPYGQIETPPGNFTDPHNHYTFTGQEWDENMGLYEFYARKYDSVNGVWLSQDFYRGYLANPITLHRFSYVLNSPTNLIDMYGFLSEEQAKEKMNDEDIRRIIYQAADQFDDVSRELFAGVVYAEYRLNVSDAIIMDEYGKSDRYDREINNVTLGISFLGFTIGYNNWELIIGPVPMVSHDTSLDLEFKPGNVSEGLAQVKPKTAKMLKRYFPDKLKGWDPDNLEDPKTSAMFGAAYLQYLVETWQEECLDIVNMPEVLATLYTMEKDPHPNPHPNEFGMTAVSFSYD